MAIKETEQFQENVSQAKTSSLLEGALTLMAIEKINKNCFALNDVILWHLIKKTR